MITVAGFQANLVAWKSATAIKNAPSAHDTFVHATIKSMNTKETWKKAEELRRTTQKKKKKRQKKKTKKQKKTPS